MNIALILSGGIGNRFGTHIPKQYNLLDGREVISYVIEATNKAKNIDKTIVVANGNYVKDVKEKYNVDTTEGGNDRNSSLKRGLDYIKNNYNCDKVIILDAVRPFVTEKLLNEYIDILNINDCVVTAQKITDSLGSKLQQCVNREDYYLMQSPEGFNFKMLYDNFDNTSYLTEVSQQLPKDAKIYLYYGFLDNLKITYPQDLQIATIMMRFKILNSFIERLQTYLQKSFPSMSDEWISSVPSMISKLAGKWNLTNLEYYNGPHFGVVVFAFCNNKPVVLKLVPPFINRYNAEKNAYKDFSESYMCRLIDYDDECNALLLEKIGDGKSFADFWDELSNKKLSNFFDKVYDFKRKVNNKKGYGDYSVILHSKINNPYDGRCCEEINNYVIKAINTYDREFLEDQLYLIHGDMHKYNIMMGDDVCAIDPIGYIAPIEFEFARFIGTELTEILKNKNYDEYNDLLYKNKEKFTKLIKFFSKYTTEEKLKNALFIDIIFRMHNATFENEDDELTLKWLCILNYFYK